MKRFEGKLGLLTGAASGIDRATALYGPRKVCFGRVAACHERAQRAPEE